MLSKKLQGGKAHSTSQAQNTQYDSQWRKTLQRAGAHSTAILASLIMVIPVYLIAINAFKSSAQASSMGVDLPTAIHLENFSTVIDNGKLVTSFVNSMLYASSATVLGTFFAAMAAYVMSRNRTP